MNLAVHEATREESGPSPKDDWGRLWIRMQHLHPKLLDIINNPQNYASIFKVDRLWHQITCYKACTLIKSYGKELSLTIKWLF